MDKPGKVSKQRLIGLLEIVAGLAAGYGLYLLIF